MRRWIWGKHPVELFKYLAWGQAHKSIGDDDLAGILSKILSKDGGADVAMEILQMRFHGIDEQSPKLSPSLIALARELLLKHDFDEKLKTQDNHDLNLTELTRICLTGEDGIKGATQVSQKLAKAIAEKQVSAADYSRSTAYSRVRRRRVTTTRRWASPCRGSARRSRTRSRESLRHPRSSRRGRAG